MSRYAPENAPSKAKVICSVTRSDPSASTTTVDVGGGQGELLGPGRRGHRQDGEEGQGEEGEALQNCTLGTLRASSPISKKSRVAKRNRAATKLVGTVCTALLYDRVLSL